MESVWWNQITNAANLIRDIRNHLLEEKSLVLYVPFDIPWKNRFDEIVMEKVARRESTRSFDVMEAPEENPGAFMLERYCDEDGRFEYRSNKTYAQFLAERTESDLNSHIVWVKNIPQHLMDEWIAFVSDYNTHLPPDAIPAVFLLETDAPVSVKARKGIEVISFDKAVSPFDAYTFCMLAISTYRFKDRIKPYFAELVSDIGGIDVEFCAACIQYGAQFLENPAQVIQTVTDCHCRSTGKPFRYPSDPAEIDRLIWKAQIKTVFPVIEDYRMRFIAVYRSAIQDALPITNSYGETVETPEETDIGVLYHLFKTGRFPTVSDRDKNRLSQVHKARNDLAHCKTLSFDEVESVLLET